MESIRRQNRQLQKAIDYITQEIEKQKEINTQQQCQIDTLLKFNERLLGIIENQVNKKDSCSLQPISERSQRESDLMTSLLNSFDKSRKLVLKSERGYETSNSVIQRVRKASNKLNDIFKDREGLKSWIDKNCENEDFSERKVQYKTNSGGVSPSQGKSLVQPTRKAEQIKNIILESEHAKLQMTKDIADLKKFRQAGAHFYDSKIRQIKDLSSKLNSFDPWEQLKNITQTLSLSRSTSDLIQKTILGGEKKK